MELISRKDTWREFISKIEDIADLEDIDRILSSMPTIEERKEGRWIPVSERLPEVGDTCIVTGKQKYSWEKEWEYFVDVADSGGDYIDDYWDTSNDWIEGQETHIIAWMPLPEPWKGE